MRVHATKPLFQSRVLRYATSLRSVATQDVVLLRCSAAAREWNSLAQDVKSRRDFATLAWKFISTGRDHRWHASDDPRPSSPPTAPQPSTL